MISLTIDRQTLTVPPGTTLLAAARRLGIEIPTLCHREGLDHVTSCMLCVVGDESSGERYPACSTPAKEGMNIVTDVAEVIEARRTALELLLSDHLGDCEGPCRRACPAGMNIPVMLRALETGRFREALSEIQDRLVLPGVLERICSAPCETVCRRALHDGALAIRQATRFLMDHAAGSTAPNRPAVADAAGFRIAVAGGGPAGLAAADGLRRKGYDVTLFEKETVLGGQLRTEALREKLPPAILDGEIARILQSGLIVETGVAVGHQVSLTQLKRQFAAVILAVGKTDSGSAREKYGLEDGRYGAAAAREPWRTQDPKVFICGNMMRTNRLAARSVGQGQTAADAVDRMVRGIPATDARHGYDHRIRGKLDPEEIKVLAEAIAPDATAGSPDRAPDGFTEDQARREAARCLHCDCRKADACKLRRYAGEYAVRSQAWQPAQRRRLRIVRNGHVVYEPGKCIACGICVRIAEQAGESLGLTFIGRGFDVRVGVPFGESLEQALQRVAADCIAACPTGALAWGTGESKCVRDNP